MNDAGNAGAVLRVDLGALAANYRTIAAQVAPAAVGGVVKADAYGLGAAEVARTLEAQGCRDFFVAHLSEAQALRPVLDRKARFFVLNGLLPGAEAACAAADVIPVLNSLDQLGRWSAQASLLGRRLPAALQVDTGMARLGLSPEDVAQLAAEPQRLRAIDLVLVMSHLACADVPGDPTNAAQTAEFERLSAYFPEVPRALDNSGGSLLERPGHFDLVRPGIALYGAAPQTGRPNPMRPVVSLEARIVQVRSIPAGKGVGYGMTFHAARPSRIATIAVGYADGWPCHLANRGSVFIAGQRVPIAGRVSMDSITLDVTDVPEEHLFPGAPVELIGPHQTVDDVARDAGTISYEILTRLGHRYARVYTPAPQVAEPKRSVNA